MQYAAKILVNRDANKGLSSNTSIDHEDTVRVYELKMLFNTAGFPIFIVVISSNSYKEITKSQLELSLAM